MNHLQSEVKDWIIEFRSENRSEAPRNSIYITSRQAQLLMDALKNGNAKFIDLPDDEGFTKEMVETRLIRSVRKVSKERDLTSVRNMICDYGTRHPHLGKEGFEECRCQDKFKVPPFMFDKYMRKRYPNSYMYTKDITPEMQYEFLHKDL